MLLIIILHVAQLRYFTVKRIIITQDLCAKHNIKL